MCGSGTTPCEALASGRSAIGADLNPLSVLITIVKSGIVLEKPTIFIETVSKHLKNFRFKDVHLENIWSPDDLNYLNRWFDPEAIRDISTILTNTKTVQEPLYRDFFRLCLSNIIRSVSWQKETDLRVRKETKPYIQGTAISCFIEKVHEQIKRIHPYLCVLPQPSVRPSLTIRHGNAVNVAGIFPEYLGKVDLLITSPPYATALPYLDTDRLSLMVLDLLPRKQHKDTEIIMVGTREVSERQRREIWERYNTRKNELPEKVFKLIDQIAEYNHGDDVGFRRRNLPALLGKYFLDMLESMRSAHAMMVPGAHGYYVVGNNSTVVNGQKIKIPTNEFLFEIGAAAGWRPEEMIPMELLISRDIFKENRGSSESILCFSVKNKKRKAIYTREDVGLLTENGHEWNFHDAITQEHLHTLHPYPAKFIPQIPRKVIETWTVKGELVYDPFVGCGTALLESSLLGRPSVGTDNNPVAIMISRAKTANYSTTDIDTLRAFLSEIDQALPHLKPQRELIPNNKNFLYWFSEEVLDRLSMLKSLIIAKPEPVKTMLLAVFSSIIVRVSYQDSDTRYAKIKRIVKPTDVDRFFKGKLAEVLQHLPEIIALSRAPVTIYQADSRNVPFIESESISLIVTSPPYLNAYDYHKYHRQRIHWIDGSVEFARDIEIGSHDEFTKPNATPDQYFVDMDACFSEWARVLRKGGRCVVIIGDAIVTKQPVPVADTFVDLMEKQGVTIEKRWIRELHSTKRAFNVTNSRISHEHVLLFKK
jgi:site-specific DNA-methyltransferase (cytosine-N4-specific)